MAACVETQQRKGLDEAWLAQLPAWIAEHRPRPPHGRALVHTELGPGHVLCEQGAITGVIDFADAALGDPDFELPAIGVFITRGDLGLYRRFLAALGRQVPAERVLFAMLLQRADFSMVSKDPVLLRPMMTLRPDGPVNVRLRWRDSLR